MKILVPQYKENMFKYIGGILRQEKGTLISAGGIRNHVHLLFGLPPSIALSDIMRVIKAKSSKWINERKKQGTKFHWQKGYGGFSVSQSKVKEVKKYIENQEDHHKRRTFEEEFIKLLEHHDIGYKNAYLFERP